MKPRRIAIFGSTGQLGADLVAVFGRDGRFDVTPLRHEDADCADLAAVRRVLVAARPDIVINSAAYVRVDDCEDHCGDAFRVNAMGAFNIARGCAEVDAICAYISTDYVFDGDKALPYTESDFPNPINVYGASKLAGEHLVRQAVPRWLIVRMAGLFGKAGARGKGGNFIETIISKANTGEPINVVDDIHVSPIYARDAAMALRDLIMDERLGNYHLANEGACTWYELAKRALTLTGTQCTIVPVSLRYYPTRARRPKNSVLRSERSGLKLRSWQDALKAYLVEKNYISASL